MRQLMKTAAVFLATLCIFTIAYADGPSPKCSSAVMNDARIVAQNYRNIVDTINIQIAYLSITDGNTSLNVSIEMIYFGLMDATSRVDAQYNSLVIKSQACGVPFGEIDQIVYPAAELVWQTVANLDTVLMGMGNY